MPDQFLALRRRSYEVLAMPEGDDRNEAGYELAKDLIGVRAPWADSDPGAAERWLVSRGASVDQAIANAAEFEHGVRALYALRYQHQPATFEALAAYLDEIHPAPRRVL